MYILLSSFVQCPRVDWHHLEDDALMVTWIHLQLRVVNPHINRIAHMIIIYLDIHF